MDELEQLAASIGAEETPPPELPPEEGAPPPEEAAPAEDLSERLATAEREREEARQAAATLEQRLRDTQAWAQTQNMSRIAAETAAAVLDRRELENQPPPELPTIPRLTAEERELIFSDPDLLERHTAAVAKYGYDLAMIQTRQELGKLQPFVMAAREAAIAVESMLPLTQELAVGKARTAAEKQGVAVDDFDRYLPHAHSMIVAAAQGDRAKYRALSTNPEAITMAVTHARSQNGVPITQKPQIPPTIGAKPAVRKPAAPAKSAAVLKAERDFGVTFGPEELAEFNRLNSSTTPRR